MVGILLSLQEGTPAKKSRGFASLFSRKQSTTETNGAKQTNGTKQANGLPPRHHRRLLSDAELLDELERTDSRSTLSRGPLEHAAVRSRIEQQLEANGASNSMQGRSGSDDLVSDGCIIHSWTSCPQQRRRCRR